nr:ABC transporter substrate-binding protein [Chromobacterium violaceum]
MAAKQFGAVAREVIEAYGKDTMSHPVGTGPFMLKEWKQGNKIVLVANPNYRKVVFDGEPGAGGDPGDRGRAAALAARTRSRCDARSRWLFKVAKWNENLKSAYAHKLQMWSLGGTASMPDGDDAQWAGAGSQVRADEPIGGFWRYVDVNRR